MVRGVGFGDLRVPDTMLVMPVDEPDVLLVLLDPFLVGRGVTLCATLFGVLPVRTPLSSEILPPLLLFLPKTAPGERPALRVVRPPLLPAIGDRPAWGLVFLPL